MKTKEKATRKRRPKGMGTITNLGKGRVRPYMASVSDSPIGYFKNHKDAELCLLHYFLRSYRMMPAKIIGIDDVESLFTEYIYNLQQEGRIDENLKYVTDADIQDYCSLFMLRIENQKLTLPTATLKISNTPTFKEIWEKVWEEEISLKSVSTQRNYKTAFNKVKIIHNIPIDKIRTMDMQNIIDEELCKVSNMNSLNNIKIMCNYVFTYAIRFSYVTTNFSEYVKIKQPTGKSEEKIGRIPFTNDEIKIIMEDKSYEAKIVLCYIFTGMRPIEFINLRKENIDLENRIMIGGQKTSNGKNRTIPIHNLILPIIKELYENENGKYIFYSEYTRDYAYTKYRVEIYKPLMKKLNLNHNDTYDTRHTFADLCFYNHVDEYAKKKIMGHSIGDLTLRVYTTATNEFLLNEINKISLDFC